jgi:uncharacterized membrane protein YeaQ/YmgE (transglycosylase-associated protein family)
MGILVAIIIGGFVGWIASKLMKTDAQMGILANVLVGIVGSAIGHWLFAVLGFMAFGLIARLIVSVIGAAALIGALRAFGVYK